MKRSDRVIHTANESLRQITGNGQFCYLLPGETVAPTTYQLDLWNSGATPLEVCHVVIFDFSRQGPPRNE